MTLPTSRVYRLMLPIGAIGTLAAFLRAGWRGALGFLVGSLISAWNYGRLVAIADSITNQYVATSPDAPPPSRTVASILLTVLRYGAILVALYVIVKYFEVNVMAALIGLFTGLMAVFIDALLTQFGKRST